MDTRENNSDNEATGAKAASAEINSDQVRDAAEQLQGSVSRFAQENQRNHENLSRLMDQPDLQIVKLEQKVEELRKATERNRDLVRGYRQ